MSVTTADPPTSIYGRGVGAAARRLGKHPNFVYRHIRRGLVATLVGGRFYVRDEDADSYFRALTAQRLGKAAPVNDREHEAADRACAAGGW